MTPVEAALVYMGGPALIFLIGFLGWWAYCEWKFRR